MMDRQGADVVFNVVWTGDVFAALRYFTASVLANSEVRLRFVLNGCAPGERELMESFVEAWPGRVVELLEVSDAMLPHGMALDIVRETRHDGDYFAMIDPDIMALAPFMDTFADLLSDHTVVSSGIEVWSTSNVVPDGNPGVAGEHFFTADGFVFGGPHFTIYHREPLDATVERWNVGLGSAGPGLGDEALARLREAGHDYLLYDTAKIVSALMQADGHTVVHRDVPEIVHVGGMSHFLSPYSYVDEDGEQVPDWVPWSEDRTRFEANKVAAAALQAAIAGTPAEPIPEVFDRAVAAKLALLAEQMRDVVDTHRGNV